MTWSTFGLDRVEAEHGDARLGEGHRERQADVAEADHPDPGRVAAQGRGERVAVWRKPVANGRLS